VGGLSEPLTFLISTMKRLVVAGLSVLVANAVVDDRQYSRGGGGFLSTTNSSADPDPDEEARDAFVKKCTVTVSVRDKRHLPVDAVESFCQETNAVVECRNNFVGRLKDTHGDGTVALQSYCLAVYNWFQKKYGMFCPDQCNKLQCKSTCAWLKADQQLKDTNHELSSADTKSESNRVALKEQSTKVKEMTENCVQFNRTADQAAVEVERAQSQKVDAQTAVTEEQGKMTAAKEKTVNIADALKNVQSDLANKSDTLLELKRTTEMAEVNYTAMTKELDSIKEKVDKRTEKISNLKAEADAGDVDKVKLEEATAKEQTKADEAGSATAAQRDVVQTKTDDLQRAKDKLEASSAAGDPADAIANYESLVKKQDEEFKAESIKLEELEHAQKTLENAVGYAKQEIATYESNVEKLRLKIQDIQAEVDSIDAERTTKQAAADTFKANSLEHRKTVAANLEQAIADTKKQEDKANKTLTFTTESEKEQAEYLAGAQKEFDASSDKFHEKSEALGLAESVKKTKNEELVENLVLEKKMTEAYQAEFGDLEDSMGEYKTAIEAHRKAMPEIVKQHGLGLLQQLIH